MQLPGVHVVLAACPLISALELGGVHSSEDFISRSSSPRYLNARSQRFVVNGTGIPDVAFDVGESYAGLLPISNATDSSELFFWFFPSKAEEASDEVVVWLTGGPGCSSLSGLATEIGPFLLQAGTLKPASNPYAWNTVSNVVFIEQPVGVGYTQGPPLTTNEIDLTQQFKGFWKSFVDTFELHNRKVYLTGESYAGVYIPYIADGFLQENNTEYYDLKGVLFNDPQIGDDNIGQTMPIVPYVDYWSKLLDYNESFIDYLHGLNDECGITAYTDKYFRFPPPPQPWEDYNQSIRTVSECSVSFVARNAAAEINPCFNVYHISDQCPRPYDHISNSDSYFDRQDVKKAINAPLNTTWSFCSGYFEHDSSLPPAQNDVLTRVIEGTNNTIIGGGGLDMLLPVNGTLFALQNTTWNGGQGFLEYPSQYQFIVPYHNETLDDQTGPPNHKETTVNQAGAGIVGSHGYERGLTFFQIQLAGHELPGYTPGAGLRTLQLLLGRIKSLNDTETPLI